MADGKRRARETGAWPLVDPPPGLEGFACAGRHAVDRLSDGRLGRGGGRARGHGRRTLRGRLLQLFPALRDGSGRRRPDRTATCLVPSQADFAGDGVGYHHYCRSSHQQFRGHSSIASRPVVDADAKRLRLLLFVPDSAALAQYGDPARFEALGQLTCDARRARSGQGPEPRRGLARLVRRPAHRHLGRRLMSGVRHALYVAIAIVSAVAAWWHGIAWVQEGGDLVNLPSFFLDAYHTGNAAAFLTIYIFAARSEERSVGKECVRP